MLNSNQLTLLQFYVGGKSFSEIITATVSEDLFKSDVERQL